MNCYACRTTSIVVVMKEKRKMGNNIHNRLITHSWVCHIIVSLILCAILCISGFAAIAEESDTANPFTYVKASVDGYGSFYYRDAMLLRDSRSLSTDLVKASAVIAAAAYNAGKVRDVLEDMGFSSFDDKGSYALVDSMPLTNCDYVAFHIAKKIVNYEGQKYIIYCVPIKGTTGNYEWFSNMKIGENGSDDHEGFFRASTQVLSALEDELATTRSTYGASNTIIWLTGHSRGAAVANFVAGRLTRGYSYVPAENIFAYTYACPSVSKNVSEFNNIYNFNIRGDLIPILPLEEWGYGRFGHTIKLGSPSGVPSSTVGYEESLKLLFPNELAAHSLSGKLALGIIANVMIGEKKLGFIELLDYLGYTIDANDFAEYLVSYGNASFADLYNAVESKLNHYDELKREWYDYYTILDSMSEEEQEQWLLDNSGIVNELSKITGQPIPDVDAVWSSYVYLTHLVNADSQPHDIERTIKNVYDMLIDANTLNLKAMVTDGHKQASYTTSINTKYYGYYGCTGRTGDVEIPEDITSIGEGCFNNCTGLTSISGGSLELIGDYAFSGCTGLQGNLELTEGMIFVGHYAFLNCDGIETLTIPNTVLLLGESSFAGCIGLKEVTLPVDLSKADGAFRECRNVETIHYTKGSTGIMADLTTNRENIGRYTLEAYSLEHLTMVEFEEGITHIGAYAFDARNSNDKEVGVLTTVVFPSTLESIGDYSFYGQKNWITTLELPRGIKSLGNATFAGCDGLQGNLILPEGLETLGRDCFNNCVGIEGLMFPSTIQTIPVGCFYNCVGLRGEVSISEPIQKIEYRGFYGCSGLEKLSIQKSIQTIEGEAFTNCSGLKEIIIPVELSKDDGVFAGCANIETIHYLAGSTGIMPDRSWNGFRNMSMEGCSIGSLKHVDFEEGIKHIGTYSFYTSTQGVLLQVELPVTLESIGEQAFFGQSQLVIDMELPSGITTLGDGCFSGCKALTGELILPEGLTYLGSGSFAECEKLTGVVIPSTITEIPHYCFSNCKSIDRVIIPKNIESLGDDSWAKGSAFYYCTGLKEVTLPIELSKDDGAFIGCDNVETIHYTKGSTGIMPDRRWSEFRNRTLEGRSIGALKYVDFEEGITYISMYTFYTSGIGELLQVELPSTLESIGEQAFYGQSQVKIDMNLPSGLTTLGDSCFSGCKSLTGELVLPEGLTYLGSGCFNSCEKLTGVVIPSTITEIPHYCFSNCIGIERIQIPKNIMSLGDDSWAMGGSFYNCSGIKEISLPVELSLNNGAFTGCSSVETIHYIRGATGIMEDREGYGRTLEYNCRAALKSICFEEGIVHIGSNAFYAYTNNGGIIEDVSLPSSLESIGECAFRAQTGLSKIVIQKDSNLSMVAPTAFEFCNRLSIYGYTGSYMQCFANENDIPFICLDPTKFNPDFILPATLTEIEEEAFVGCAFKAVSIPDGCLSIASCAFAECGFLEQITIPASVSYIAEDAFGTISGIAIFCPTGSAAETFAIEHGYVYVIE